MKAFYHFNFNVLDLERSLDFYKKALNPSPTREKTAADQFDAPHRLHREMGRVCFENPAMGLCFISDPDSCRIEIVPVRD